MKNFVTIKPLNPHYLLPSENAKETRTYRRNASKDYLSIAHKKQNIKKAFRKAISEQLSYVRRNIITINKLLSPCLGLAKKTLFNGFFSISRNKLFSELFISKDIMVNNTF